MEAVVILAIVVVIIAGMWKMYAKAGEAGWACLIPIYNIFVLVRIAGRPWWWLFLFLIPVVGWIIGIIVTHDVSKRFGFGVGMTLLLLFLPFIGYPVIGFGSAAYDDAEA